MGVDKWGTPCYYEATEGKQPTESNQRKGGNTMPTAEEVLLVKKATVYDILDVLENDDKKEYTEEEIKQILKAYITGCAK